ncbi:hypothetical protein PsorP6_003963 [Peronosclerospora sorghi]|uniref:Uncharacterized protein n=1 Tax=Peronosclerospora sorghi TaxID=230839 RepID=A0ACC0VMT4_9STRA|nr:hypothetical protein PsorP6_003963 [Peronosclerospora sorghi]
MQIGRLNGDIEGKMRRLIVLNRKKNCWLFYSAPLSEDEKPHCTPIIYNNLRSKVNSVIGNKKPLDGSRHCGNLESSELNFRS